MSPREFSNKIIHAKTFTWVYAADEPPQLICYARDNDNRNWKCSEVNLVNLAAFCGRVMS